MDFGGKKGFFVILGKGAYFCKKQKKKKDRKTPTLLKRPNLQPVDICTVRYTLTVKYQHPRAPCYTPTLTEALTHKHMDALFTHPQSSHPTDADISPETHSLILGI